MARARRAALLDRDGTIVEDRYYSADPDRLALIPRAIAGLRRLRDIGVPLVVITNQSGIARGYFTMSQAEAVNDRLRALLAAEGIMLDGIYMCPHAPADRCGCRKPATGLVERAARELGFDAARSWVIGDKRADMELGRRLGATTILVRTGYGREHEQSSERDANHVVDDLAAAAVLIERDIAEPGPRP